MKNKGKVGKNSKKSNYIILVAILLVGIWYVSTNLVTDKGKSPEVTLVTDTDINIVKSEISDQVKFYGYKDNDTYMEVMAVKATDGTIRTALNTCQICYDSGRGYYIQQGDTVVCQNCGNVFNIDDIQVIKGGCNPIPIMEENRKEDDSNITIEKAFLQANKDYFSYWKKD